VLPACLAGLLAKRQSREPPTSHPRSGMASATKWDSNQLLFVLCGIGLNVTFAIYLAYIREYGPKFSKDIFGWANVSIYVAASATVGISFFTDQYVVNRLGSKVAYSLWINLGLFVMAVTLFCIPFAGAASHVYTFGVLVGIFEGKGLSTLQQLAAVVDGEMTKYVNTGFTIAQVVPIGLSVILGFHNPSASRVVDLAFAWIPSFFCLSAMVLFYAVVLLVGKFDECFVSLDIAAKPPRLGSGVGPRESSPLIAGDGKYAWLSGPLLVCAAIQFVTHAMSMFLMPFLTYFGGAEQAHILVLVRFGGEMLGRLASHHWGFSFSECLKNRGPLILSWLVLIRCIVLVVLVLGAFRTVQLGNGFLLHSLTGFFYFVFAWTHSEVMAISVDLAPKEKVAGFTQGMMFLCFSAQLLSLAAAIPLVQALSISEPASLFS